MTPDQAIDLALRVLCSCQKHCGTSVVLVLSAGRMTMGQIGKRLKVSSAAVTGLVDRLVLQEYVERSFDADDRRVIYVSLTEAGHVECQRVVGEITAVDSSNRVDDRLSGSRPDVPVSVA